MEKLTKENSLKKAENDKIIKELVVLNQTPGEAIKNLMTLELQVKMTSKYQRKDNSDQYRKISECSEQDVQQLVKIDKEIERLFEIQLRKNNKNNEMIRNKINSLNDKPSLRNFLFKQVSDQELQKDIAETEKEIEAMFSTRRYAAGGSLEGFQKGTD